jgi:hypothetical protein
MSYDPFAYSSEPRPPDSLPTQRFALDPTAARQRVQVPAILLIVAGVVSLVMEIFPAMETFGAMVMPPAQFEAQMEQQNPQSREQMKQLGWTPQGMQQGIAWGFGIWSLLNPLASILVIVGGVCMLRLKGYSWAVFASVLSALPFCACSGCCGLGQIAGLWALVVLLNPEVRAAFS